MRSSREDARDVSINRQVTMYLSMVGVAIVATGATLIAGIDRFYAGVSVLIGCYLALLAPGLPREIRDSRKLHLPYHSPVERASSQRRDCWTPMTLESI